jgi:hypothetical protein
MVRRQGKRRMQAALESGNGEKKEEGESSFSHVDAPDICEPKHKREKEQRFNASRPGLCAFHLFFKSSCIEFNR